MPRPARFPVGNLPLGRFSPRGEKPLRFSPHPFFGVGEKRKRLYCFFTFERPAFSRCRISYGGGFTRGLNARVHSAFCPRAVPPARGKPRSPPARSRATRSQRPCAGGGCRRLFCNGGAYWRVWQIRSAADASGCFGYRRGTPGAQISRLFAKQFERRSCFATGESEGVYFPYTTERTTEQGARCAKVQSKKNGRPCSDEQLRLSFRSKNTQIVGNKRSLIPVANSRPNGGFRTIDSPFVKIPPQIERTCAVWSPQIPFSGEFSTPKAEFVTKEGGNSGKSAPGLSDFADFCRISPFYRRRAFIPLRPFAARSGAALPA